ncbi:glycosyltransferase family 47 protein [Adhaeribacter rhizoryzae]|uniref:RXYLT1 C-terminal domain-containing protein n=1 Tax=Adhaeribacter rhizoryzae TaxID=2607907 RepID=A0A5M6DPJ1_9BACT|nr:hypothetical protein [Adhaeribacter rhizoryzae]KAA5548316.1 hypothetical protein F0145_06200 [Adhaeribacter rhizoryzae]
MLDQRIKINIPEEKLLSFRELGYIDKVLDELFKISNLTDYEVIIYFKLNNDKKKIEIEPSSKKQIVFFVCDESDVYPDDFILNQIFLGFRHYLPCKSFKNKLFYLPVGYSRNFDSQPVVPIERRSINVFFSGNLHLGRARLYRYFTKLRFLPFAILYRLQKRSQSNFSYKFPNSHIQFNNGFHTGLSSTEYNKMIYKSKIVLCPPGLNQKETMRHFESMKAGSIIISERMPNVHTYQNSPMIFVEHWNEIDSILKELINSPQQLANLHKETLKWWQNVCDEKSTAKYIYELIKEKERNL